MNLRKTLSEQVVLPSLRAVDKEGVLAEMTDALIAAGRLDASQRENALAALRAREARMSTGMQHGVAIPHAKTDAVDRLVAALAIHRQGLSFDALDGLPSTIFVMTLSPLNRTGPHIQFLAEISRLLSDAALRKRLLSARTREEMLAIF